MVPKVSIKDADKYKVGFLLLLLANIIYWSFQFTRERTDRSDYIADQRVQKLNETIVRKDSIIGNWQERYIMLSNELLYKNNIIDRQQAKINNTDSVSRAKLEPALKGIIKK